MRSRPERTRGSARLALAAMLALPLAPPPATAMQTAAPDAGLAPAPAPLEALAIVNARVWTGDARRPWADAILIHGERIDAVGSSAAIRKRAAGVRVIDAKGMMVTPGFIDAHVHFLDGGFALRSVQLRDARTKAAFIARLKAFAATMPPGAWILNGDWDHEHELGRLAPGMLADVVLIDRDLTRIPAEALREAKVVLTIVGGRVVWDRDGLTR